MDSTNDRLYQIKIKKSNGFCTAGQSFVKISKNVMNDNPNYSFVSLRQVFV